MSYKITKIKVQIISMSEVTIWVQVKGVDSKVTVSENADVDDV